jgi:hypothetical protein
MLLDLADHRATAGMAGDQPGQCEVGYLPRSSAGPLGAVARWMIAEQQLQKIDGLWG